MKIHNWMEYRIPGLLTIALFKDHIPGKYTYKVIYPDYEDLMDKRKEEQSLIPNDPLEATLSEIQVISMLKRKYKFDLGYSWHTLFDLIYNFAGVNLNPETKGFLAFISFTKEVNDGIDWNDHEREIKPSLTIPRRTR